MLSRQYLGIEVPVQGSGYRLVVRLSANAEDVGKERDSNGLALESAIHGNEVQNSGAVLILASLRTILLRRLNRAVVL